MENHLETNITQVESASTFKHNMTAVAKGGGVIFTGRMFLDAVRFVTAFVLARLLGAKAYGMYSLALSATNIGVGLALLGLDAALIRYVAVMVGRKDDESVWGTIQVGVSIAMLLSVVSGTLLFGFAYPIAENAFHKANLAPLLQLAAVLIPILTMSEVLASITKGFKRMDYPVIAQFVFQPVFRLIMIGLLALSGFNPFLAIATFGLADLGASLLMIYYLNRIYPLKRPLSPAKRDLKGLLAFSLPVWMSGLMVQFQSNLQALVLGTMGSITGVGLFAIASQITAVSGHFTSSINVSSKPIVAQLYDQKDMQQLGKIYQTANKWAVMVQLPIFLVMVIYPTALLSIFGNSYVEGAAALIGNQYDGVGVGECPRSFGLFGDSRSRPRSRRWTGPGRAADRCEEPGDPRPPRSRVGVELQRHGDRLRRLRRAARILVLARGDPLRDGRRTRCDGRALAREPLLPGGSDGRSERGELRDRDVGRGAAASGRSLPHAAQHDSLLLEERDQTPRRCSTSPDASLGAKKVDFCGSFSPCPVMSKIADVGMGRRKKAALAAPSATSPAALRGSRS
jgi:O-antigen/teichoic acid export membrane protein